MALPDLRKVEEIDLSIFEGEPVVEPQCADLCIHIDVHELEYER